VRLTLCVFIFILFAGCESRLSDGTGSQTGNSVVAGRIAPSATAPQVSKVKVFLRPLSWTSGQNAATGSLQSTFTDSAGNYRFFDVPADTYRIEAALDQLGWSRTVRAHEGATHTVPAGFLLAKGHLVLKLNFSDTLRGGRVEFYGLDRYKIIPESVTREMVIRFDNLPVGLQTVRVYLPTLANVFCETPVRIGPDSVSTIEYGDLDRTGKGPAEDD
jgi:hypothetical protein